MRKHLFIVMLALLALFAGSAAAQEYYTLPEIREQAANGWHQTYTDKYGRTRQVDVDIEVFGEDTAPVVKACWNSKDFRVDGPLGNPVNLIPEARKKGKGESIYLYDHEPFMKVDLDRKYAEGYENNLALREVYDFCATLMQEMGKDFYRDFLWEQPSVFSVPYSRDKKTGGVYIPAIYSISFLQEEFGLPIITHVGDSFQSLNVVATKPSLQFNMSSQEAYSCSGKDFTVSEILAEDIPLCSVKTAIEGARTFIESGYVHDVTGLRFGYVVYSDPEADWSQRLSSEDVNTWYLVPSWVMTCVTLLDPKVDDTGESPYYQDIAINAQTGEITNYFDTSLKGGGDVRYKGFIPWDSVK